MPCALRSSPSPRPPTVAQNSPSRGRGFRWVTEARKQARQVGVSEAESARSASDVTRATPGQQGSSAVPDIDRRLCDLVAAVDRLQQVQARALASQAGMAADLAALRLSLEGKTRRDALLRDLANYLDLGCST